MQSIQSIQSIQSSARCTITGNTSYRHGKLKQSPQAEIYVPLLPAAYPPSEGAVIPLSMHRQDTAALLLAWFPKLAAGSWQ